LWRCCELWKRAGEISCHKCGGTANHRPLIWSFVSTSFHADLAEFLQLILQELDKAVAFRNFMYNQDYASHKELRRVGGSFEQDMQYPAGQTDGPSHHGDGSVALGLSCHFLSSVPFLWLGASLFRAMVEDVDLQWCMLVICSGSITLQLAHCPDRCGMELFWRFDRRCVAFPEPWECISSPSLGVRRWLTLTNQRFCRPNTPTRWAGGGAGGYCRRWCRKPRLLHNFNLTASPPAAGPRVMIWTRFIINKLMCCGEALFHRVVVPRARWNKILDPNSSILESPGLPRLHRNPPRGVFYRF
jgi:hypothetical protein